MAPETGAGEERPRPYPGEADRAVVGEKSPDTARRYFL